MFLRSEGQENLEIAEHPTIYPTNPYGFYKYKKEMITKLRWDARWDASKRDGTSRRRNPGSQAVPLPLYLRLKTYSCLHSALSPDVSPQSNLDYKLSRVGTCLLSIYKAAALVGADLANI